MDAPIRTTSLKKPRVAILCPGDAAARKNKRPNNDRFEPLVRTLDVAGLLPEYAVYHDDFCAEVRAQILAVDAVLVWVNPIEDGRDRSRLDAMLREVSAAGVFVSAHPDVILKLGTKQILYDTRAMEWGSDVRLYRSLTELEGVLPVMLRKGEVRVLKQYRGNGGNGVWKVSSASSPHESVHEMRVKARHALRGCVEQISAWKDFLGKVESYFDNGGCIIDQPYQDRLTEGMVRCYLVHDTVAGFGLQAINALYPTPAGDPFETTPPPTPRIYHPATLESCRYLKHKLEGEWIPQIKQLLGVSSAMLPVIWDCDFLLGPKDAQNRDTYVLCEINVSSVSPFPDSALEPIAAATLARIKTR
jgi:Domain of unknown function (DUF6815)